MRLETVLEQLMQSWRSALRNPRYVILSSVTLGVGIAAVAGVFSLASATAFAPIALPSPDRLVVLGSVQKQGGIGGLSPIQVQNLVDLPGTQSLGVAAPVPGLAKIGTGKRPSMIRSWQASPGFLSTLGVSMRLGRGFTAAEGLPGGPSVAVLSYSFWQSQFSGAEVLGQSVRINDRATLIVGVLPADFPYHDLQVLVPLILQPNETSWSGGYLAVARLLPGTSYANVAAAANERLHALDIRYNMTRFADHGVYSAQPFQQVRRSRSGSIPYIALFGMCAAIVLLIVVVNLSNLSLLRMYSRDHDNSIRAALGASMFRLLVPILGEQLLVAFAGTCIGLLVAWIGIGLARTVVPADWIIGDATAPSISWSSSAMALLIAEVVACAALGTAIWRSRHAHLNQAIVSGSNRSTSRSVGYVGRALVVLQATLATLLVLIASLFAKTLWNLSKVDYGFEREQVMVLSVRPDRAHYPTQASVLAMADAMLSKLNSIPGVEASGYGTNLPASGRNFDDTSPYTNERGQTTRPYLSYLVSPGYLSVLGVGLEQGRGLGSDQSDDGHSILVSSRLASLAPDDAAMGKTLTLPLSTGNSSWNDVTFQIRGITKDIRALGAALPPQPVVWIPFSAATSQLFDIWRDSEYLYFVLRVRGEPSTYTNQIQAVEDQIAPALPIVELQPMSAFQATDLSRQRLELLLVVVFAGVSLLLASIGMYSVMAVTVANRQKELGIRAAIGATPLNLLTRVLVDGWIQIACGLALGLLIGVMAVRVIRGLLYETSSTDPMAIGVVLTVLSVAGAIACLGPALRAARVQPARCLTSE